MSWTIDNAHTQIHPTAKMKNCSVCLSASPTGNVRYGISLPFLKASAGHSLAFLILLFCQQNQRQQNAQQQKFPHTKNIRKYTLLPPFPGPRCIFTAPELQTEVSPSRIWSSGFYHLHSLPTCRSSSATSSTAHSISEPDATSEMDQGRAEDNRR